MSATARSPFPGMNPWLEHPALWPNVHQSLITYSRDSLQSRVGARYFVAIGERVTIEAAERSTYPDLSVGEVREAKAGYGGAGADRPVVVVVPSIEHREVFLEIHDVRGDRIVTVLEVLSPANKRPGPDRESYLRKQRETLASTAHLVEIDLLRGGEPTVALPRQPAESHAYRVAVSRADDRTRRELYPIGIADRLPRIAVPLLAEDADVVLDLQAVLDETWTKGGFARRIDYGQPAEPPLTANQSELVRPYLA